MHLRLGDHARISPHHTQGRFPLRRSSYPWASAQQVLCGRGPHLTNGKSETSRGFSIFKIKVLGSSTTGALNSDALRLLNRARRVQRAIQNTRRSAVQSSKGVCDVRTVRAARDSKHQTERSAVEQRSLRRAHSARSARFKIRLYCIQEHFWRILGRQSPASTAPRETIFYKTNPFFPGSRSPQQTSKAPNCGPRHCRIF
jgi:hypothetical protein